MVFIGVRSKTRLRKKKTYVPIGKSGGMREKRKKREKTRTERLQTAIVRQRRRSGTITDGRERSRTITNDHELSRFFVVGTRRNIFFSVLGNNRHISGPVPRHLVAIGRDRSWSFVIVRDRPRSSVIVRDRSWSFVIVRDRSRSSLLTNDHLGLDPVTRKVLANDRWVVLCEFGIRIHQLQYIEM